MIFCKNSCDISSRYANLLIDLSDRSLIDDYVDVLINIMHDDMFYNFIINPFIKINSKLDIINSIFLDNSLTKNLFIKFLKLILDNGRINMLGSILLDYKQLSLLKQKEMECNVIFAYLPSNIVLQKIKKLLSSILNKKITLNISEDINLVAGMKLLFNNYLIDLSVKSRLEKIKAELLGE